MMSNAKVKLLIVDDEPSLRTSLSQIFATFGHGVRSAGDGFAALGEIQKDVPDILLSDLNMPGMSGFELLSVVRRRFPAIQVIAMSGAFSGNGIPLGVAADAFYEKGRNPGSLFEIVNVMAHEKQSSVQHRSARAPIWIAKNGHDPSGVEYVMITCPDCLRTFPQVLGDAVRPICEASCVHCSSLIHYAIVPAANPIFPQGSQLKSSPAIQTPLTAPDLLPDHLTI